MDRVVAQGSPQPSGQSVDGVSFGHVGSLPRQGTVGGMDLGRPGPRAIIPPGALAGAARSSEPLAPLRTHLVAALIDSVAVLAAPVAMGIVGYFAIYRPACDSYRFLDGTRLDCRDAGGEAWISGLLVVIAFVAMLVLMVVRPLVRRGATWAMRRSDLLVIDAESSGPLSTRQALVRTAVAVLVSVPWFGVGVWWAAVDRRGLMWHDLIADTRVVQRGR